MQEPVRQSGDCPVCAGPIAEDERIVCGRCETPHHRDCFSYNQGCAIFACNPDRPSTPLPKKQGNLSPGEPVARSLPWAVRIALFSTAGLATFLLAMRLHLANRVVEEPPSTVRPRTAITRHLRPTPGADVPVGIEVGQRAPDFELKGLDGYDHSFSSHSHGHISVLTIWLERCADCMNAFPKGVKLSDEFAGSGVYFTDVAYLGTLEKTGQWVKEAGITNPVLLDTTGEIVRRYRVGTYTCFVLDPAGIIRYRGPISGAAAAIKELQEEQ